MKLNIHFFNVGKGDSIIVEIESDINKYLVIDSHLIKKNSQWVNPAYEFLKSKKVERINGLVITHFHLDHFAGVELFLKNFEIGKLYIPPVLSKKSKTFNKQLKNIRKRIIEISEHTNEDPITKPSLSFSHLIHYLSNNEDKIEELQGKSSDFMIPDIEEFTAKVFLPLAKIKGIIQKKIENSSYELDNFSDSNEASITFSIKFNDYIILFTGDSTMKQWREHKIQMKHVGINNLNVFFLKVPHHGSKNNNNEELYKYLFKDFKEQKYIFISADGRSHPHNELFDLVEKFKLIPYCTNLAKQCASNLISFNPMTDIPPKMRFSINNYDVESSPIPCQGDITLSIDSDSKDFTVQSSNNMHCLYRTPILNLDD